MNDEQFIKAVSELTPSLYSDPLREETRRRLLFLLVSSIVTILLVHRLVSPTEVDFFGFKIAPKDANSLQWISWLFTVYGLSTFSLACYQDLKTRDGTTFSTRHKIVEALDATAQQTIDWNTRLQEAQRKLVTLGMERIKAFKAYTDALHDKLPSEGKPASITPSDTRLEEAQQEFDRIAQQGLQPLEMNKALQRIASTSLRLYGIRVFLDVVFPSLLALYALLSPFIKRILA
jgi:hypothetical protein